MNNEKKSKSKKSKDKTSHIDNGKYKDITEMFKQTKTKQSVGKKKEESPSKKSPSPSPVKLKKKVKESIKEKEEVDIPKKKIHCSKEGKKKEKKSKIILDDESSSEYNNISISSEKSIKQEKKKKLKKKEVKKDMDIDSESLSLDVTPMKKQTKKTAASKRVTTNKKSGKKNDNEIVGPLSDITIVITGEFMISRDRFTNILKGLGARVTGSVSSKTNILIHGDRLEDGREFTQGNKYKLAVKHNVTIYDLGQFEQYMKELVNDPDWTLEKAENQNDSNEKISIGKTEEKKIVKNEKPKELDGELWSVKYQPQTLEDIIGNSKAIVNFINGLMIGKMLLSMEIRKK